MLYLDENNELHHADSFDDIIEHYSFKDFKRSLKRMQRDVSRTAGKVGSQISNHAQNAANNVAGAVKKVRRWGYTNGVPNGKRKAGDRTKNPMGALRKGVAGMRRRGRKLLNDVNTMGGRGITINDPRKTRVSNRIDKDGYMDEYKTRQGTRYASVTDLIRGKKLSKTSTTEKTRDNIGGRKWHDNKTGQLIDNRKKKKKKKSPFEGSVETDYSFKPRLSSGSGKGSGNGGSTNSEIRKKLNGKWKNMPMSSRIEDRRRK